MPITFQDIEGFDNGAQFFNADLHVHSYGASTEITDTSMTVQAIIEAAVKQNIALLSITDHNSDKNIEEALDYAQKYTGKLLLIPGVEITTSNGHLLAYFPPDMANKARDLLARINLIGDPGAQETHTTNSMADVIREVEALGGIAIAAHIDLDKIGFEKAIAGYPNPKKDILISSGLYGLEVKDPAHLNWYSANDDESPQGSERKKLLEARANSPSTVARPILAHVQGSDAHTLKEFRE